MIRSVTEYACEAWHGGLSKSETTSLENLQKRALHIIFPDIDYAQALNVSGLEKLSSRRNKMCIKLFNKIQEDGHKLNHLLPPKRNTRKLRKNRVYEPYRATTDRFKNSPINFMLHQLQDDSDRGT